jgi:hypothetical protein
LSMKMMMNKVIAAAMQLTTMLWQRQSASTA